MFRTVLLSFVTIMHIYVFWRARSVPFLKLHIPRKFLIGTGLILWTGLFLGIFFGHGGTSILSKTLEMIGMTWIAILFLMSVSLLAIDFITGFGFILPRIATSLRGWALFAGGLLSVIALVQGLRPPVVQKYDVYLSNLPDKMNGKVIVALSDLHIGSLLGKRWLEARVLQVQEQQPDIIFLLGDIYEGHGNSQEELLPVLRRLSAPLGVWAVYGNHESYHHHNTNMFLIKDAGFQILNNVWVELQPGLVLAGVEDLTANQRSSKNTDTISKALNNRPSGATILLSHSPLQVDKAASAGVELMLSGHTHGGQIWPFDYLIKQFYPFLEGLYEVEGITVIVSRGTGTWGPRMRLWQPGEISRIILHKKPR